MTLCLLNAQLPEVPTMKGEDQIFTFSSSSKSGESSLDEHIAAVSEARLRKPLSEGLILSRPSSGSVFRC